MIFDIPYTELYPIVEMTELDKGQWNTLLSARDKEGRSLLISLNTAEYVGQVGHRVWVRFYGLHCEASYTTEVAGQRLVTGRTYFCTSEWIEKS